MKTPRPLALLLTIAVQVGAGFPADRRALSGQAKHASWDDVNVVAHGLLQLGQGLRDHVDKTKGQVRDANAKLRSLNGTVAELERRQRERDEALRARGEELEVRERLVAELAAKVEEVKRQNDDIDSRMDRLEEKMAGWQVVDSNGGDPGGVLFIQKLLMAQDRHIDQLVEKIQQQQDKMEKQSVHLQALHTKVAHRRVKPKRRRDGAEARGGARGEAIRFGQGLQRAVGAGPTTRPPP